MVDRRHGLLRAGAGRTALATAPRLKTAGAVLTLRTRQRGVTASGPALDAREDLRAVLRRLLGECARRGNSGRLPDESARLPATAPTRRRPHRPGVRHGHRLDVEVGREQGDPGQCLQRVAGRAAIRHGPGDELGQGGQQHYRRGPRQCLRQPRRVEEIILLRSALKLLQLAAKRDARLLRRVGSFTRRRSFGLQFALPCRELRLPCLQRVMALLVFTRKRLVRLRRLRGLKKAPGCTNVFLKLLQPGSQGRPGLEASTPATPPVRLRS